MAQSLLTAEVKGENLEPLRARGKCKLPSNGVREDGTEEMSGVYKKEAAHIVGLGRELDHVEMGSLGYIHGMP